MPLMHTDHLQDSIAANNPNCNPSEFKTTSFGHCAAMCSFVLTYYRVNDPDMNEVDLLYINWDHCDATGCCIRTRTIYNNGTIVERAEPAYFLRCPVAPPNRDNCNWAVELYQYYIESGRVSSYGWIFTNMKEIYFYDCDARCW